MTCPLASKISFSAPTPRLCDGKCIRPSRTVQPRLWANSMTLPSLSRNNRILAFVIGSDTYALSLHDAISERMVPMRTCDDVACQYPVPGIRRFKKNLDELNDKAALTSEKMPYSSLGTFSLLVPLQTRS